MALNYRPCVDFLCPEHCDVVFKTCIGPWKQLQALFKYANATTESGHEEKYLNGRYWVKVFKNGPSKICGRHSL